MLQERDGSFSGYLEYRTDLFSQRSGGDFAGSIPGPGECARLRTGLRDFFASCFSATGRRSEFWALGATSGAYPREARIGDLFAEVASERGGSVAVICGGEAVSYAALEARANRLAHYLVDQLGALTDRVVGLRSIARWS